MILHVFSKLIPQPSTVDLLQRTPEFPDERV